MELARTFHKSLKELFEAMDSRELGLWTALYMIEADEQNTRDLVTRAETARRKR